MPADRQRHEQASTSPNNRASKPVVSDVQWTLLTDQATYAALLRLIFEDPAPVLAEEMKRLKGASWRR